MWIEEKLRGVTLRLLVQPRASSTEICGLHGEPPRLKIRVASPPVDGEANEALIAFLSKKLGIPKNSIEIAHGSTGKLKDLICLGIQAAEVEKILLGSMNKGRHD